MRRVEHVARDRAGDLHAHDRAEAAPAQVRLDGLEQVVCVVRDLGVAVARQAEERALHDLHLREQARQEVRQHGLERHQEAARADRDEAVEAFRHLHPREPLLAGLRVANEQAEAERQARDVRERLARPDGERREHREDLAREDLLELGALGLGRILDAADEDPLGGERGAELVAPERRLLRRQVEDAAPDLGQRLLRRAAVGRAHGEPREHLVLQAGDPHHEELVEDRRDDPAELDPLEQRLVRVGGELEHAPHEVDLRQLAVEQCVVAAVGARFDDRRQALQSFRNGLNGRRRSGYRLGPAVRSVFYARCRTIACSRSSPSSLGVVLIVIAVIYWVEPASSLPSFFPGHQAGSSHHHVKHGIAAFLVGLACFAFAWFQTGPKRSTAAT